MDKILWADTETTGLSDWKHGIIQIAGFVEINGEDVEDFNFRLRPFPKDEINNKALEVNGITRGQLETFPQPEYVYEQFVAMLEKHVDKFDKEDKFVLAGYNVGFDKRFLTSFFKKNDDPYFHSYVDYHILDVMSAVQMWRMKHRPDIPNIKLITVAKHFGFDVNFHDALDDIRVTRQVYHRVMEELG